METLGLGVTVRQGQGGPPAASAVYHMEQQSETSVTNLLVRSLHVRTDGGLGSDCRHNPENVPLCRCAQI